MPVTTTTVLAGALQPDGRQRITERHEISTGGQPALFEYLAAPGTDTAAIAAARAALVNEWLAAREAEIILGAD